MTRRRTLLAAAVAGTAAPSGGARAQPAWPSRPVRFVVGFPAGGTSDVLTRLLQPRLSELLGQPVVVENRPGAGTVLATDLVAKAPADGYTVLNVANSFTINAALVRNPPFDARRDFAGIASLGFNPHVLVAAPNFAPRTVAEVVAAARTAPGRLTYASFGNGTSGHLGGESFKQAAGVDIQHVPYRGGTPALADLMGGQVQLMFANLPEALPLIRENRIRPIAVADAARAPVLPDVPTFDEAGVPGVVSNSWFGVVARAEVPPAVADRMHGAITAVLGEPDTVSRFRQLGVAPRPMARDAFGATLRAEFERNARVVRDAGITAD
jgi:tripartite-type tricarboxylate transporter receptor subunit TctC